MKDIIGWTASDALKKGNDAENILTVKKEADNWKFYINDQFVYSTATQKVYGYNFGIVSGGKQAVAFDDLVIKQQVDASAASITVHSTTKENILMNETFIINSGQWPQDSDKYVTTIVKDGKYTIDNKIDVIFYNKPVSINEDQDFSISISAVHKNGGVGYVYGMCFGYDDADNNYQFGITASGKFVVSRSDEGVFRDLISFVPSAAIKKEENAVNILTIRQEENNWRFYINDQWVASSPKLDFFNKRAGFYVEGKQKIDFDDLIIKQLEVTKIYKTKLCLIEKGVLKEIDVEQTQDNHITAVINGTTQGFWKNSPPDILGYAAAQPWYINNEPITFKGFNFSKYGNVKSINMAELKKLENINP